MSLFSFENDKSESQSSRPKKAISILSAVVLVISGSFFLKTTLAANININTGLSVEFGQGVAAISACSGSSSLTVTPNGSFTNSSGSSGTFYFKSVTISGIPSSCYGYDFQISAFDSTTGTAALSLFNTSKTVATIYNNAGTFQVGAGGQGSSVTSSSGSFTVTFTTPAAFAGNVSKLTLQSLPHVAYSCLIDGICNVGDIGVGGGTVFYTSVAAFTETGTVCNTNCHTLEWAPNTWNGTAPDPGFNWSSDKTHLAGANGSILGTGYANTTIMLTSSGSYVADASDAAFKVHAYAGNDSSAGQWFLPSFAELLIMWNASGKATDLTGIGGFDESDYWASTEVTATSARSIQFTHSNGAQNTNGKSASNIHVRPIRAF